MTHVDRVSTFQVRYPVRGLVLMKADNFPEQTIFPSRLSGSSAAAGRKE